MRKFSRDAQGLVGQPMFNFLAEIKALELATGKPVLHFEIGDPLWDTPLPVINQAAGSMLRGRTHYVQSTGTPELKEAVCRETEKRLGFTPTPDQVLIAPANSIIYLAIRCLVDRGEAVCYPDPGFPTYRAAVACTGVRGLPVPLYEKNDFAMQAKDIPHDRHTRLIIINSPQNPTGAVLIRADVWHLYEEATRRDCYLLSDETYSRLTYGASHDSPSCHDLCRERVIILNSFSKTYSMTGWRLGYAIGPAEVIAKMGLLFQTICSCLPAFIQDAGITALTSHDVEEWVGNITHDLRFARDQMVALLNTLPGVSCRMPAGAFYVFPNIQGTHLTGKEFAQLMLHEAGVGVLPGSDFGERGEGYVRLSYAVRPETITEACEAMRRVLLARSL